MRYGIIQCLIGTMLLMSCGRETPEPEAERVYFPIEKGKYRTYWVEDTTYTTSATIAKGYYKQEQNDSLELDGLGRTISRLNILRAEKDSVTGKISPFSFQQLWTQYSDKITAERIEGNTRYVVLQLPIQKEKTWNGNLYNDQGNQIYRYISTDSTIELNNKTYPHCVVVLQRKIEGSIISDVETYEIYAPGIGKIARYDRYLQYNYNAVSEPVLNTSSYIYREILIDNN